MTLIEFFIKTAQVRNKLAKLLQLDLSDGSPMPLHKLINSLNYRRFVDDKESSELDVVRLEYLIKHLSEIERHDPSMLRTFRREFRRAKTQDNFEGLRFECYAAARFARKQLRHQKSEAPDFIIDDHDAAFECTSVRLTTRQPLKDLSYKVEAAISSKEKTKSNRDNVILLIDITNILHGADPSSIDKLRPIAQERISRTSFASVVMFCHVFEERGRRISTNYLREDSNKISDHMLSLANLLFPKGDVRVCNFYVPATG